MKKKAYLICPVTKLKAREKAEIEKALRKYRREYNIYIPYNTDQTSTAKEIFLRNRVAMYRSQMVFFWYNKTSEGSIFDFGMAYALTRPVIVLNKLTRTDYASFINVLLDTYGKGGALC